MGLQNYDFTISPTGTREIGAEGSYICYYSGNAGGADETILIKGDTNALTTLLKPGQKIKLPERVKTWKIESYKKNATIKGILVIGDGEIQDSQVAGVVSVVDGNKQKTLAGSAFCGRGTMLGAAGLYGHSQVWNPAGSGVNLVFDCINLSMSSAGILTVGAHSAALTDSSDIVYSKEAGDGVVPKAQLRRQLNAALLSDQAMWGSFFLQGNITVDISSALKTPLIIPPGKGLNIICETQGVSMTNMLSWTEDVI